MLPPSPPTEFARLGPSRARLVLAATVVLAGYFAAVALSPRAIVNPGRSTRPDRTDPALYRAEAERVRQGEGYYDVLADELPRRGYPTRSVFNWRTPLPVWLIGRLPDPVWAKVLLNALGLVLALAAFEAVARDGSVRRALGTACLLIGPLWLAVQGDHFYMPVLWAGTFVGLSVAAYGIGKWPWGVALGLAAAFFRELALPYCVLCAALAGWEGRRREQIAWAAGLGAWGLFFSWHCVEVLVRMAPDAVAHQQSWLRLLGAPFVLATAQMHAWLIVWPQWIAALYFLAAMLGLAGWNTPLGRRVALTVCLYAAAFAVLGQPFNQYWGGLVAPLLCFGVARLPASLGDLGRAAWRGMPNAETKPTEAPTG